MACGDVGGGFTDGSEAAHSWLRTTRGAPPRAWISLAWEWEETRFRGWLKPYDAGYKRRK